MHVWLACSLTKRRQRVVAVPMEGRYLVIPPLQGKSPGLIDLRTSRTVRKSVRQGDGYQSRVGERDDVQAQLRYVPGEVIIQRSRCIRAAR